MYFQKLPWVEKLLGFVLCCQKIVFNILWSKKILNNVDVINAFKHLKSSACSEWTFLCGSFKYYIFIFDMICTKQRTESDRYEVQIMYLRTEEETKRCAAEFQSKTHSVRATSQNRKTHKQLNKISPPASSYCKCWDCDRRFKSA